MHQVKLALGTSTSHGLPRIVANKPARVRITWLLLYLLMLSLFLKGLVELICKLQSRKVTTFIDSESEKFQFPGMYVCFENPISGSYSEQIDAGTAATINKVFNAVDAEFNILTRMLNLTEQQTNNTKIQSSFVYVFGLPYSMLIDKLAHRIEQSVISSKIIYIDNTGAPRSADIELGEFNHPLYLRCLRWIVNSTWKEKMSTADSWSGLTVALLLDANSSFLDAGGNFVAQRTFTSMGMEIPVSDWSMSLKDYSEADRVAGVKVFLCPPGEYPSDFVSSFSLGPGKYHSVEIKMTKQVYTENCLGSQPNVQFVNPYDLSPYSHAYSYSYCYYYEYHRLSQQLFNLSGQISPLPWPLRNRKFIYNLSGTPHYGSVVYDQSVWNELDKFAEKIRTTCMSKRPCTRLDYSPSISSANWPTRNSLTRFINSSVRLAWKQAGARNLSAPALDFLITANASSVTSYVYSNLLKLHLKPSDVACDRITFSIDYGLTNFVSEVGGIMGIYLGMSLLTLCEIIELLHNCVASNCRSKPHCLASKVDESAVPSTSLEMSN